MALDVSELQTITHDELCGCCNGGRLLPAACFEAGAGGEVAHG